MSLFNITNLDKNVKIKEEIDGLTMYYVLSCPSNFPLVTFKSKNKSYYRTHMFIPYGENMSKRCNYAYNKLKLFTMIRLNDFKIQESQKKSESLKENYNNYLKYK